MHTVPNLNCLLLADKQLTANVMQSFFKPFLDSFDTVNDNEVIVVILSPSDYIA